jgi:hypothetical protein
MKKEEFPTFLNEQPTVVFGRTTRELLIISIGLAGGYLIWLDITGPEYSQMGCCGASCDSFSTCRVCEGGDSSSGRVGRDRIFLSGFAQSLFVFSW